MERQKTILGRKKKGQPPSPGDFIALGSKAKGSDLDLKRPPSPTGLGRKRDSPTTAGAPSLAKKQKLGASSSGGCSSDDAAITVDPLGLLSSVLAAEDEMNEDRSEALICAAVKLMRSNRAKPDLVVTLTLMHLSKIKPALFCTDVVTETFCGLLKREVALSLKTKGNPLVSVLACNILMASYAEEENWPESFIKVFVEDSLGDRVWVDREDCHLFVDNIITAFGSKRSPKHLMMTNTDALKGESPSSPSASVKIGEEEDWENGDGDKANSVFPRYQYQQNAIETYILDTIRDILSRRQPMDSSTRNLIRLMSATSGYGEVRSMAAQRMDMWLQNPKLTRVSQDLLLAVCTNCNKHDKQDLEVMVHLTKMRMKTKQLINHFLICMRELLSQHPENLRVILNHTVYNELSTSRNPNNMPLAGTAFSHSPDRAPKMLAEIFQDLLTNKDDYLRALRMLLREIVRVTRLDMNFSVFCLGLMQERTEAKFTEMDLAMKERYVVSIADLVSMDVLLSVSHNVREAAAGLMQGDKKNLELVNVFKKQVATIERDSVWWLHIVVPKILDLKVDIYLHCLKKVLFLESPEQYYNLDNWPPESERGMMLRLASDAPVLEDTLMRLLVIGLFRDLPLSPLHAITLVDQLVCRAAQLQDLGFRDVLKMERLEFLDTLLNLCIFKHPENIILPQEYSPPNLAITGLMWKAWLVLLVITAYNAHVFGENSWQKYPILQIFMEMVMTNNYTFPPPTTAGDEKKIEEYQVQERQIRQQEIQLIIEFETHLAAATSKATITESTSHLIGQLNHHNPSGPARFPPPEIIEQLKSLNSNLKLGQMLCRSRNPDFLLQIINRQGTSQAMPWLAELVESSEGSLEVLPVQCLCEFLLHEPGDNGADAEEEESVSGAERMKMKQQKNKKHHQLLSRLQELVRSPSAETKTMKEVLDYFLKRLSSIQASTRDQAIKGLSLVVRPSLQSPDEGPVEMETSSDDSDDWLLVHMPSLPLFEEVRDCLCMALRKACQVEAEPARIQCYIMFLSENTGSLSQQTWNEMALDLTQMLIERTSVMQYVLPKVASSGKRVSVDQQQCLAAFIKMFLAFMKIARTEESDTFSWSNSQDQILVKWDSGQSATIHVLVVHAIIILLTYGRPYEKDNGKDTKNYKELLDMWIQPDGHMPLAFLLDTSEEALLLPDWLKLRMLRSEDERLVNAALLEAEPAQLVMFVQSFGIPVANMSRLLSAIDQALADDPTSVSASIADKQYLMSLVDIQRQRGAKGGDAFYALLTDGKEAPKEEDEIKPEEEMEAQESWNVERSGEIILPNSVDKISRLLDQILSDKTGSEKGPAKLFQCFIQAVSTDKVKAAAVIKSFDNLLSSSKREAFAEKVYEATFRSCPILKILHAKQPDLHPELLSMMEKLQSLGPSGKSMLTSLLTQVLTSTSSKVKQTKQPSVAKKVNDLLKKTSGKGEKGAKAFIEGLLKMKDPIKLEKAIDYTMEQFLHKDQRRDGTMIACLALARDDNSVGSQTCAKLLIDWLSLLDPEIVHSSPELEERLIFARRTVQADKGKLGKGGEEKERKEDEEAAAMSSQAHLLALLTHQTSWLTLNRCLTRLLDKSSCVYELDPTAALDFIWACSHIPKVWQGREKKMHEVIGSEDILGLTVPQTVSVVDLIIEEAVLLAEGKSGDSDAANQNPRIMTHRVNLLLLGISDNMQRVIGAVHHLHEAYTTSTGLRKANVAGLAIQMYLHFPYILSWLPETSALTSHLMGTSQLQSQIDVVSHRMISSLGQIKTRAQSDKGAMYDANIVCRKLAAHHPSIFLRQLPLISSLLAGQTAFSMAEMRHTNRLLLFTHVLGLLELLQPLLFEREHVGLEDVLSSFFALLQNHAMEAKSLGPMLLKLVNLLQNFLSHDPERSFPMLNKQMDLFSNMAYVYPDMLELKALITSLTLPRQAETLATDKTKAGPDSKPLADGAQGSQPGYTAAQLAPFLHRLSRDSSEDVHVALQDLDELSKRKVDILSNFQPQLQKLLLSPNDQCRGIAFTLVMRFLRYSPRKAENFISSYLDCLESEEPNIVTSGLKNLAEFCALCQEDASTILQTAFLVGIKTSQDASPYIGEALQLLNLHVSTSQG